MAADATRASCHPETQEAASAKTRRFVESTGNDDTPKPFPRTAPQTEPKKRPAREDFVRAARASDRSHTSAPPEPSLPRTSEPDEAELQRIVEAANQRSPTAETGQAG